MKQNGLSKKLVKRTRVSADAGHNCSGVMPEQLSIFLGGIKIVLPIRSILRDIKSITSSEDLDTIVSKISVYCKEHGEPISVRSLSNMKRLFSLMYLSGYKACQKDILKEFEEDGKSNY